LGVELLALIKAGLPMAAVAAVPSRPSRPKPVAATAAPVVTKSPGIPKAAPTVPQRVAIPVAPFMQRRRVPAWVGYSMLGLLMAGGGAAYGGYSAWRGSERIAPQFFIQGESIGGLTRQEARGRLEQRFGRLFVKLEAPDDIIKLGLTELGGRPDYDLALEKAFSYARAGNPFVNMWRLMVAQREEHRLSLPVVWDNEALRSKMWTVANQYKLEAQDASLKVGAKGAEVVPHTVGRSLNVDETIEKLQQTYFTGLPKNQAIVRTEMPRLTSDDLAGVDVKLGEYRTGYDSGIRGRTKNIHLASLALNGRVLMPGESFSFNATTGERTSDKGYRIAHIFVHKRGVAKAEVVDGLGGGVCQVSTTLYNAVRKANKKTGKQLRILELNHHSLPVTYASYGLDATVAWPHKDFRFRNKFPHPIYLKATAGDSRLNISVWGRVPEDSTYASSVQATRPTAEKASKM